MSIRSYRDLLVWRRAMDLVVESYQVSKLFPKSELYGLAAQLQRAAVSVAANIAEGHGRDHLGDYLHHRSIATGSLMELETHLLVAHRLSYHSEADIKQSLDLCAEVSRMLSVLSRKLKNLKPST